MISKELLRDIIVGGLVVLSQLLLFRYLNLFGAEPDVVLLYLLWIIATRDRTTALMHAAIMGLSLDFFLDIWGLHIISKTLMTFICYNLLPRINETKLVVYQVFVIILVASLLHNLIFSGMAQFAQVYRVDSLFWTIWIGNTLFTAFIGSFVYSFKSG